MKSFSAYHPLVLFLHYAMVLVFTMFTMHPVLILEALTGGAMFYICMNRHRPQMIRKDAGWYGLLLVVIAVGNLLFSHDGETVLFFAGTYPVTMEALFYGGIVGGMLIGVLFWCKCYQEIMTTDKILYLFGKTLPKLALLISMTMRFVPDIKEQAGKISQAQKTLGLYGGDGKKDRLKNSFRVFGAVLTWSLEHAVDTSDSMKARGYGEKGRTDFSIFRFHRRDGGLLLFLLVLAGILFYGIRSGVFYWHFYPTLSGIGTSKTHLFFYLTGAVFSFLPGIMEIGEEIQWSLLRSKI